MRFSLLKAIGWGVVLYACADLTWSLVYAYGWSDSPWGRTAMLATIIATAIIATHATRRAGWRDRLPYALVWLVTVATLDVLFAIPSGNWLLFSDPNLWVGYALVFFVPLIAAYAPAPRPPHFS